MIIPLKLMTLLLPITALSGPIVSESPVPLYDEVTPEDLPGLLTSELEKLLSDEHGLIPLPANISNVFVSPSGEPCFTINPDFSNYRKDVGQTLELLSEKSRGFRLMFSGSVIGWNDRGEIVVTSRNRKEGYICTPTEYRPIDIVKGVSFKKAIFCCNRWIYETSHGIFTEGNNRPWPGSEEIAPRHLFLPDKDNIVIAYNRNPGPTAKVRESTITVGISDGNDWTRQTFTGSPLSNLSGLLLNDEGRFTLIGSRICDLKADSTLEPTEQELSAVLSAVKAKNWPELNTLLANITTYPAGTLTGLANLLANIQDDFGELHELQEIGRNSLGNLTVFQQNKDWEDGQYLKPIIEQYMEQSRQFIKNINRASREKNGPPIKTISKLLAEKYQYYDGQWIRHIKVLKQNSLSEAMVHLQFYDLDLNEPVSGIFLIDKKGELNAIETGENCRMTASCDVVPGINGDVLLFNCKQGLARINDRGITWLDKGIKVRRMGKLLGCDSKGRIYFQCGPIPANPNFHSPHFWVYGKQQEVDSPEKTEVYSDVKTCKVDANGHLWFIIDNKNNRSMYRKRQRPLLPIPNSIPMELIEEEESTLLDEENSDWVATLYRRDADGTLYRYFQRQSLRDSSIQVGREGSVLLWNQTGAILIHGNRVYRAKDMSELAASHLPLLFKLAPRKAELPIHATDINRLTSPSWLVVDDILWLGCNNKIEAYRNGESLHIHDRLALRQANWSNYNILGPFQVDGRPAVVITPNENKLKTEYWAIQGEEGIELRKSSPPYYDWNGKSEGRPVLDYISNCRYYHKDGEEMWAVCGPDKYNLIPSSGSPVLVLPGNGVLVRRPERTYHGYRTVSDSEVRDLPITFIKPLAPVSIENNGDILCLTHEGLAWIKTNDAGEYVIDRKVSADFPDAPTYYGGSAGKTFYVLTEQEHLVVINE